MSGNTLSSSELYNQARKLMDSEQYEKAVSLFRQSVEIDPHFKTLELLGECYIRLNLFKEAVVPLAAAVSLNKGVRAASLLADVFFRLEKFEYAENMAIVTLSRDSKNKIAQNILNLIRSKT